jgi:hypothetical protein
MKPFGLTVIPFLLLASACMSDQRADVIRSSYSLWERNPIKGLGFSVELPKDRRDDFISADASYVRNAGGAMYHFSLHPIHLGALAEDRSVIEAFFVIMSADQYRVLCENKGRGPNCATFASTIHIFHDSIKEYRVVENGMMGASVFRRDYIGSNGEVVAIAIIRRDYADAESWRTEDIGAIDRILNSLQFTTS